MITEDQSKVIALLSSPETHGGGTVERIKTHASIVFLAGDRARKLKRAFATIILITRPLIDGVPCAKPPASSSAGIGIQRKAVDAFLHQKLRELRVIARRLAAVADLPAGRMRRFDYLGNRSLDRFIALIQTAAQRAPSRDRLQARAV